MTALNSYSEKLQGLWSDTLLKTQAYSEDVQHKYTFFGLDARMELSKLNRHFGDFCFQLKDAATGKQVAKYCQEAVVGI